MSQLPDPDALYSDPVPLSYAQEAPSRRPTSVTVLAIIGIILGAMSVLGVLMTALQAAGLSIGGDNPVNKAVSDDPFLHAWNIFGVVLGLVLTVLLLVGSIGALLLKPIGRSSLIAYSWADIIVTAVTCVITVVFTIPRVSAALAGSSLPAQMQQLTILVMWVSVVASVVFLVYPALVLYYMSRPHVRSAFQSSPPAAR